MSRRQRGPERGPDRGPHPEAAPAWPDTTTGPSRGMEATGPLDTQPPDTLPPDDIRLGRPDTDFAALPTTPGELDDALPLMPVPSSHRPMPWHEATQRLDGEEDTEPSTLQPVPPQVGQVGRYHLESRLGQGGLGTVWSAYDSVLARQVAVKTLTIAAEPVEREHVAARVLDEARAAARLSHPHIVTVHDAGVSSDGAYIAMELLRGKDLGELLRSGWRPSPEQAAMIVRRVADALGYAHSKGVIHRDVKPANIFMVGRTRPVVLDFGLARLVHHSPDDTAFGSPFYAAPEQYDGRECDARSDVYSLGVVLYELLTGQRPYVGSTLDEIRAAVRNGRAQRPSSIIPSVPKALESVAMQAIDVDPAARPRSAGAMARELRGWLATLPTAPGASAPQTPIATQPDLARRPGSGRADLRADTRLESRPDPRTDPPQRPLADADLSPIPYPVDSVPAGRPAAAPAPAEPGSGPTARPSMLSRVAVGAVLALLVLVGWLLLGRG